MKQHECAIAATPVDETGMAHGLPVTFEAVKRGVKCGLGAVSDGVVDNVRITSPTSAGQDTTSVNGGDMFGQMRMALQFHRGPLDSLYLS